jgi:hypothetical protein
MKDSVQRDDDFVKQNSHKTNVAALRSAVLN